MSHGKLLIKITSAVMAAVMILSVAGCSLRKTAEPAESSVPENSAPAGEILQRRRASAAENSRVNAAVQPNSGEAVKADENDFLGKWADYVSGRCYMDVTVIQDEFLSIVIYWSDSVSDTVYWSLLGEYDSDTGTVSYEGMQFRESFSSERPEYKIMNGNVSGSLYITDDGSLRWSERESCRFENTGTADQPYTFVEMEQGEGYIYKTPDQAGEPVMVLPEGAIVGATPEDQNVYAVFGNVSGYLFYASPVSGQSTGTEPADVTYGSEVYIFWGEDVADYLEDYDEYIADDEEYAAIVVFAVENDVRQFSLDSLTFSGFDDEDNIVLDVTDSYFYGTLSPDRELAVQLVIAGSLPNYGISFMDAEGVMRHQYITVSGEDGSVMLIDYEQ